MRSYSCGGAFPWLLAVADGVSTSEWGQEAARLTLVGVIVYTRQRAEFYRYLRGIVEAGFGKRVMFGSDQMVWPETIERGIAVIEEAPFLSEEQKRDILYGNAARFLRLDEDEIARHHGTVQ